MGIGHKQHIWLSKISWRISKLLSKDVNLKKASNLNFFFSKETVIFTFFEILNIIILMWVWTYRLLSLYSIIKSSLRDVLILFLLYNIFYVSDICNSGDCNLLTFKPETLGVATSLSVTVFSFVSFQRNIKQTRLIWKKQYIVSKIIFNCLKL